MNKKKVICFIDSLNSGGAQKQLIFLANGLCDEYEVTFLIYHDLVHFRSMLDESITLVKKVKKKRICRFISILNFLLLEKPDYIISFLRTPNLLSAFYKLIQFRKKTVIILGERNFNHKGLKLGDLISRFGHLIADSIVCNSKSQYNLLLPYFEEKLAFIPNGTPYLNQPKLSYKKKQYTSLIIPARFIDQKNPYNLLCAINDIPNLKIYWYGETFEEYSIFKKCSDFIKKNNLEDRFKILPATSNIYSKIKKHDALILPSFYEGCPNAIIDGMYCGVPILASNVSDNLIYLNQQKELLFNPHDVDDIKSKIIYFMNLSEKKLKDIGEMNVKMAKYFFDVNKMVDNYKLLLK